jgi:predicted RNase H-like HicB family nuclease
MHQGKRVLRCYAEQQAQCLWVAVCVDLNLAAQGETYREVRRKLNEQIDSYVFDALAGDDRPYAEQLLSRRAPLKFFLKYYLSHLRIWWRKNREFLKEIPRYPKSA